LLFWGENYEKLENNIVKCSFLYMEIELFMFFNLYQKFNYEPFQPMIRILKQS
jgi:hypothetical protein